MAGQLDAPALFDREFLGIRCRLIDIAASLDRLDRPGGADAVRADARLRGIEQAAAILIDGRPDRAQRVQMVFSKRGDSTSSR